MNQESKGQRIEYFDTAKGILIILVVLGHVFETGPVNQYVYSFHMPSFFIISGIMQRFSSSQNKSIGKALLGKIYSLIIPFLFFEVLGVLSNIIRFGVTLNIFGYASNTLRLCCNNGPNWFIWALFVSEILFLLIHRFLHNKPGIWLVSTGISLFMIINHNLYSTFGSTGVGFLFLTFGYYFAPIFMQSRSKAVVAISAIVSIVTCFANGKVDLGPWIFGSVPLYIISALSGTLLVIEVSKFISSKTLTHIGQNTLTILVIHQVINLPLKTLLGISQYSIPMGIAVFVGIILVQFPIIAVFNRVIPFLIGRKRGIIASNISEWLNK